jgi:hypothetical protein
MLRIELPLVHDPGGRPVPIARVDDPA